ncbi:aldo/keto reductase [Nocardia terpenica]|uniref:Aldo/keto reductase n=1 Tax=Nocardia terpenica TaxID=455432 RepID=A0A6G9ZE25_9NOCA|nr:aldo/keto reductase [Nocardia terpenica]QIS23597.1 aldo/keto reductase [Nocardia terpenica]
MLTRTLGDGGPRVSALGGPAENLGLPTGWDRITDTEAFDGLCCAYEKGVTLYDVADVYGHGRAESTLGRLVRQIPRDTITVTSKVGYGGDPEHPYTPDHMRRQLERSLTNLGTDHIDLYFFHHNNFGPHDSDLDSAVGTMQRFRAEGLIRAVGMRGPHRYALDRLTGQPTTDKYARFHQLFSRINPQVIAVRDNLLTPSRAPIFTLAAAHGCGVLTYKPLAQGLLTGSYTPRRPRRFGPGDHRSRKRWFTDPAIAIIDTALDTVRHHVGDDPAELVRIALWSCLDHGDHTAVLAGFTTPEQVTTNIACLNRPPEPEIVEIARAAMHKAQTELDAAFEVFTDQTS